MTIITPLPTPPSRDDPTTFNSRADAFLGALPTFASEMNEAAESMTAGSIGVYSALRNDIPLYGDAVVAIKVSTDRWVIRTPVANGGPHDYAEYEMYNWGAYQGIAYAWGMHSLRAEIGGQITHRCFQRRFRHAHHIVMRHDALGTVIGERNERTTILHQRHSALRDSCRVPPAPLTWI